MKLHTTLFGALFFGAIMFGTATPASATEEVCGDAIDNDGDGLADDGCFPYGTVGICESPLECARHPTVAPGTGNMTFWMPPDLSPTVPYGPGISFRRVYVSKFDPGYPFATGDADYKTAMGYRWQHNYMSYLEKFTSPNPDEVFLHTVTGRDIKFTHDSARSTAFYDYYAPQPGHYFDYLRQDISQTYEWELRTLTGWVYVYSTGATGKLKLIKDPIGNVVSVNYNGNGQVDEVIDDSTNKRLDFTYYSTGKKLLQYVKLYTKNASGEDLRVTTEFLYSSEDLTSVKLGATTVQSYTYSGGMLETVKDGENDSIATFVYDTTDTARVVQVQTGQGDVGYEFGAAGCDGGNGTHLYYHRSNGTACASDANCGSNEYCGGETGGAGSTGICFKVRRCVAFHNSNEDLINSVSAVTGGAACTNCVENQDYGWFAVDAGTIDGDVPADGPVDGGIMMPLLSSTTDAKGMLTTYERNSNGLITKMVEASGTGDARTTYYLYGDSSFPGLVTEIRRLSELTATTNCNSEKTTNCKRTIYTYTSGGQVDTTNEKGFTYNTSGSVVSYDYTTDHTYNSLGQVTSIDGPLAGSGDVTDFTYHTDDDLLIDKYLFEIKRKTGGTGPSATYVTTALNDYSYWGYAGTVKAPNGDHTCRTFDSELGYMTESRQAGNDQTECTTTHSSDATTKYTRDTWGRLTKVERPTGNCIHHEYDTEGRHTHIKRRDDCTPANNDGDTIIYTYDTYSSLRTKVEHKDDGNTLVYQIDYTHYNDMRVQDEDHQGTTYNRTRTYYDDGKLKTLEYEDSTGKTEHIYDNLNREEEQRKYSDATNHEDWLITPGVQLDLPTQVEDPDTRTIDWVYDDMRRKVKQVTPDSGTTLYTYDEAGRRTGMKEAYNLNGEVVHTFVYDKLGRVTSHDDDKQSCETGQGAEIQYVYDSVSSCPAGGDCNNIDGRLAYVKVMLWCDPNESDKTFDQETFYGYDNLGRLVQETILDDSSRSDKVKYTYTKSGQLLKTTRPSNVITDRTFDDSGVNNDGERPYLIKGGTTQLLSSIRYNPNGAVTKYRHDNKANSNYIWAEFVYNKRPRLTKIRYFEDTSDTDVFKIDYTTDDRGRYDTKKYGSAHSSVTDSYYTFNNLNRVECDAAASGACPPSGGNLKTSMTATPPYTPGGDRKVMAHAHAVYGTNTFTTNLVSGKDQINTITYGGNTVTYNWDDRGNRLSDNDDVSTRDRRSYTYDGRNNLLTVVGYLNLNGNWRQYEVTNAYDHKNRRIFKSFLTKVSKAQWFYYYDAKDRLIEIKHTPNTSAPTTYSLFQIFWLGNRPVHYWQTDYPGVTLTRRYFHADHQGRPLEVYDYPTSGNASRVWAIDPDLFGWDDILLGASVFQPLRFPGQIWDEETIAVDDSNNPLRPGLHYNWHRTYDPYTGTYMQVDPKVDDTWEAYGYVGQQPVMLIDPNGLRRRPFWRTILDLLRYIKGVWNDVFDAAVASCSDNSIGAWSGFCVGTATSAVDCVSCLNDFAYNDCVSCMSNGQCDEAVETVCCPGDKRDCS